MGGNIANFPNFWIDWINTRLFWKEDEKISCFTHLSCKWQELFCLPQWLLAGSPCGLRKEGLKRN